MRRSQILSLFTAMRSSCPNSNGVCDSVSLRRMSNGMGVEDEEFELELKWNPDEPSLSFLKKYALQNSLEIRMKAKSLTINNLNNITPRENSAL